jgi:hypothetical protein
VKDCSEPVEENGTVTVEGVPPAKAPAGTPSKRAAVRPTAPIVRRERGRYVRGEFVLFIWPSIDAPHASCAS